MPPLLSLKAPAELETSDDTNGLVEKPYSAWNYMIPRYWMPFGYVLDGGFGLQASTGSTDPLGRHAYNLAAEWDSLTKQTGGTFAYTNRQTPVAITATASQVYRYSYTSETSLKDTSFGLAGGFDIPFMFKNWNLALSWRHSDGVCNEHHRAQRPGVIVGYNSAIQRGYDFTESGAR